MENHSFSSETKLLDFKLFRRNFESLPHDTRVILEKLCKRYAENKQTFEKIGLSAAISVVSETYYLKATPDEILEYLIAMGNIKPIE
jgi:TRAP-type mannitol/chloroaromatic compound transport system substrate-binding protein